MKKELQDYYDNYIEHENIFVEQMQSYLKTILDTQWDFNADSNIFEGYEISEQNSIYLKFWFKTDEFSIFEMYIGGKSIRNYYGKFFSEKEIIKILKLEKGLSNFK